MSKQRRILLSVLSLLRGVMVLAVLGAAFVASLQRPATAEQSYPWCVQGRLCSAIIRAGSNAS
jgi:hypothetical protein